MVWKRILMVISTSMIGKGILASLHPSGYLRPWLEVGPAGYRRTVRQMMNHPEAVRAVGILTVVLGLLLGLSQTDERIGD